MNTCNGFEKGINLVHKGLVRLGINLKLFENLSNTPALINGKLDTSKYEIYHQRSGNDVVLIRRIGTSKMFFYNKKTNCVFPPKGVEEISEFDDMRIYNTEIFGKKYAYCIVEKPFRHFAFYDENGNQANPFDGYLLGYYYPKFTDKDRYLLTDVTKNGKDCDTNVYTQDGNLLFNLDFNYHNLSILGYFQDGLTGITYYLISGYRKTDNKYGTYIFDGLNYLSCDQEEYRKLYKLMTMFAN